MTENNTELSRRGLFKSAGMLLSSLLIPQPSKEPIKDPITPERFDALVEYQRLSSLVTYMGRAESKGNPLKSRIMEWKRDGDEVAERYFRILGLDFKAIEGKPVYVVLTNQSNSKKNRHKGYTIIASDWDSMYNWKAPNPNYQPGVIQTSGGENGPRIEESVTVNHEDLRRLKFVVPEKPDFNLYLNSLGHKLGYDLQAW